MDGEPKTRILFVDDSRLMLKSASKTLSREFEVVAAVDGEDAWRKLEQDPSLQVLFTDLEMPRCDGFELLRRVRQAAEPGLQSMPVIVVTGTAEDEKARVRALDMGATDFITKPFASTDLLARARAHAKYQRITRQLQAQAMVDPLTGLASKAEFLERLQQDIAYARRHRYPLTLLRLEIEDLRGIFLKRGKTLAEQLVIDVANRIRARIRKEDTAARIGLGGFAIAMPGGELEGIQAFVARLRSDISANASDSVPVVLHASVLGDDVQDWPSAAEAMDRCKSLADPPRDAAPAMPAASMHAQAPPPEPKGPTATASVNLDALLDLLAKGQVETVLEKLPEAMRRLAPLLRLLDAKQRGTLIRYLQGPA